MSDCSVANDEIVRALARADGGVNQRRLRADANVLNADVLAP